MSRELLSLQSLLSNGTSGWGKQILYRRLLTDTFSKENQLVILSYILEHYTLLLSPREDFNQNPTLDDRLIAIMDTWEDAWSQIINEGFHSYKGYNEYLIRLQTLCS